MSFRASTTISAAVIELVIGLLLPLLLPVLGGDVAFARAIAFELLEDYNPTTGRELRLAGEAVAHSLKSLDMLARSADPEASAETEEAALKWATALARSSHQAQRRLELLQRPHRSAPDNKDVEATADAADITAAAAADMITSILTAPEPRETEPTQAREPACASVAEAETALRTAETLLGLMEARYKGAPPPHTKAAQEIQAQRRVAQAARMQLQRARQRAAQPVTAAS